MNVSFFKRFWFSWRLPAVCLAGLLLSILMGFRNHPFYVSVTEINHNAADKTLEISCKLFTNDFEAVLDKNGHSKTDLSLLSDKAGTTVGKAARKAVEGYVAAYITKHLQLSVDGKPVSLQYIGSEKEQDATWSYFQVIGVPVVHKLDITNSLLYDGFDKEINIMHVAVGGNRKSGKLNWPDTAAVFTW